MQIVGVGFDQPEANQAWAEDEGFSFELWSDDDKTLAVYYGAAADTSATLPARVTRILDEDGVLVLEYAVTDIGLHPSDVLADCKILFGSE
ncbi:MAG: redoxin domain-containing protein [Alphaproteobacteria bacterium]|nr:redoxin domain-containing protein [Alphaproteobacteria bacterium]